MSDNPSDWGGSKASDWVEFVCSDGLQISVRRSAVVAYMEEYDDDSQSPDETMTIIELSNGSKYWIDLDYDELYAILEFGDPTTSTPATDVSEKDQLHQLEMFKR